MAGPPIFSRVITRKTRIGGGTRRYSTGRAHSCARLYQSDLSTASATLQRRSTRERVTLTSWLLRRARWPLPCRADCSSRAALIGYAFSLDAARGAGAAARPDGSQPAGRRSPCWAARLEQPTGAAGRRSRRRAAGRACGSSRRAGPTSFAAPSGARLDVVFRPMFGLVHLTDPVEITNTRFIVGYNGVIDLCAGDDLQLRRGAARAPASRPWRRPRRRWLIVGLLLLVGAGARGGLTGLAAGVCADRAVRLAAALRAAGDRRWRPSRWCWRR